MFPPDFQAKMQADALLTQRLNERQGISGPSDYAQILKGVTGALRPNLSPTNLVQFGGQGSTTQSITTKGFGTCGSVSGDVATLTPMLTSAAYDSYAYAIPYGPADSLGGNMRDMDTSPPGSTARDRLVLGHVNKRVGAAGHITSFDVGPGLRIAPYGQRLATNPDNPAQSKVGTGTVDPVVNRPLIELSLGRGIFIDKTVAGGADGAGQTAPDPAWGDIPTVKPDGSMVNADGTAYSGPFGWPGLDSASVAAAHSWLIGGARSGSTGGFLSPNIGQRDYPSLVTLTATGPSGLGFGSATGKTDGNQLMVFVDGTTVTIDQTKGWLTIPAGGTGQTGLYTAKHGVKIDGTGNPPSAPTLALATGTALGIGAYQYVSTFVTKDKETKPSPVGTITTTSGNQSVTVTLAAVNTTTYPDVLAQNIYRTLVGGTVYHLVTQQAGTAGGSYTDSVPDSTITSAASPPTSNPAVIVTNLSYADAAKTLPNSGLVNTSGTDSNGLAINTVSSGSGLYLNGNALAIKTASTGTGLSLSASNLLQLNTATSNTALGINGSNVPYVQVDGTSITYNASNQLQAAAASYTAGSGIDATRLASGVIQARPDLVTIDFNSSGELEAIDVTHKSPLCCVAGTCNPPLATLSAGSVVFYDAACGGPAYGYSGATVAWETDIGDAAGTNASGSYSAAAAAGGHQEAGGSADAYQIVYGYQFKNAVSGTWGPVVRKAYTYNNIDGCAASSAYFGFYAHAITTNIGLCSGRRVVRASWNKLTDPRGVITTDAGMNAASIPNSDWYIHPASVPPMKSAEVWDSIDPLTACGANIGTPDTTQDWCQSSLPIDGTTLGYNGSGQLSLTALPAGVAVTSIQAGTGGTPLHDAVILAAGTGVAVTESGQTITIAASNGGSSAFNGNGQLSIAPSSNTGSLFSVTPSGLSNPTFNITNGSGTTTATIGNASNEGDLIVHGSESILPINSLSDALLINAPPGFAANLLNLEVNGVSKVSVNQNGVISAAGLTLAGSPVYPFGSTQTAAPANGTGGALPANATGWVTATLPNGTAILLPYWIAPVGNGFSSSPAIFSPGVASPGHA